jgi:hypothetical protein
MKLSNMICEILSIINRKYSKYKKEECFDITQIKTFCKLHKQKNLDNVANDSTVSLTDINFSSPDIKKIKPCTKSKQSSFNINTPEFMRVYSLFIKILYSCLILEVDIFHEDDSGDDNNFVTLKNNYQLIRSINICKKKYIGDHIDVLNKQKKNAVINIISYEKYVNEYLCKIKILDKLCRWISIFEKNDNLFSLILPYFYTYTEYIEEYVG